MENEVQTHEKLHNSSTAAFWATILFIVLVVTAINFVQGNSGSHEEKAPAATEHQHAQPTSETTPAATENQDAQPTSETTPTATQN